MADTEFEELTEQIFDKSTAHGVFSSSSIAPFYSLVHDVVDDDSPIADQTSSSNSHEYKQYYCYGNNEYDHDGDNYTNKHYCYGNLNHHDDDDNSGGRNRTNDENRQYSYGNDDNKEGESSLLCWRGGVDGSRRRRKLPEIPKNKKSAIVSILSKNATTSLADELSGGGGGENSGPSSILVLKCGYLWDDSPESDRFLTDGADSGHSTTHSPTNDDHPKSLSPILGASARLGSVNGTQLEIVEATHRALHKFVARHDDELPLEIGDAIYVQKEADDLWCEGVNLRTGQTGIFPSAYAVDCDYSDWDSTLEHGRRERYLLGYIGSVETLSHKGTSVVCQAVRKILDNSTSSEPEIQPCTLEISDQGLRMVDRRKRDSHEPCIDYFYSLKNVSFCAFHPRDHRYLGFITKHPTLQRFACHVFKGGESTRPVAEAVGRAFQRFYQKFIETAYPVEDIYIE